VHIIEEWAMALTDDERKELLGLARQAVAAAVAGGPLPRIDNPQGVLAEARGCFVTLKNHGHLRGCIGTFRPADPLATIVVNMARAAAREDPRFVNNPITADELDELTVEVSVLSPLEATDDPLSLQIGVHGIYVMAGGRSGCFLPEVATDLGWDAEEFLSQCCAGKAGLSADAWRDPAATVYLFTTEKISE